MVVETRNFVFKSTADGIVTQSVADSLENFRDFLLEVYGPFFTSRDRLLC